MGQVFYPNHWQRRTIAGVVPDINLVELEREVPGITRQALPARLRVTFMDAKGHIQFVLVETSYDADVVRRYSTVIDMMAQRMCQTLGGELISVQLEVERSESLWDKPSTFGAFG